MAQQPVPSLQLSPLSNRDARRYIRWFSSIIQKFCWLRDSVGGWELARVQKEAINYRHLRPPPPISIMPHPKKSINFLRILSFASGKPYFSTALFGPHHIPVTTNYPTPSNTARYIRRNNSFIMNVFRSNCHWRKPAVTMETFHNDINCW